MKKLSNHYWYQAISSLATNMDANTLIKENDNRNHVVEVEQEKRFNASGSQKAHEGMVTFPSHV